MFTLCLRKKHYNIKIKKSAVELKQRCNEAIRFQLTELKGFMYDLK